MNISPDSKSHLTTKANIGLILAGFGLVVALYYPVACALTFVGLGIAWPTLVNDWRASNGKRQMIKSVLVALAIVVSPVLIAIVQHWVG